MSNAMATGSFVSGLFRVFEAGEKLLIEQAELVRLDSRERIANAAARAGLIVLGSASLFTAWLGLLITWVVAVDALTLTARLGLAVLAQLALGIGLLALGRRERPSDDAPRRA